MNTARDLSARLRQLLRAEHGAMADFLLALVDFDRREAWRELGHTSLFGYLHRELGLSKGAAFYRKAAADLLRDHPEVIEPLRDGRLCLSTVGELARVLTPENKDRVLPSFFHLSKREAQEVAAALDPVAAPPRREVVTALRPAPPAAMLAPQEVHPDELEVRAADHPAESAPAVPARPPPPSPSTPPSRSPRPSRDCTSPSPRTSSASSRRLATPSPTPGRPHRRTRSSKPASTSSSARPIDAGA